MRPDFSPAMLRFFLAARLVFLRQGSRAPAARVLSPLRKAAGIDVHDMRAAIAGRLKRAEPRARLWATLGHFPADHGITLTDDGGQFSVLAASGPAALPPDGAPGKPGGARSGARPAAVGGNHG